MTIHEIWQTRTARGGQIFYIRTDHIGRPVFATNDLGVKVWEASYLPFGGVHTSTGGIDLRFPGQWFQAESGLHQNWMRDHARAARDTSAPLPEAYHRLYRVWFAFGFPAFLAMLGIVWLMLTKPAL